LKAQKYGKKYTGVMSLRNTTYKESFFERARTLVHILAFKA